MPDAEFLYESCTCESGMRNGERCADCGGRGIVVKGTKPTGQSIPAEADTPDDGLDDLGINALRSLAKNNGLPTAGTKAVLIARIRELADDDDEEDGAEGTGEATNEGDEPAG